MKTWSGIRDWRLEDICLGSIVKTMQGTIFLVDFEESRGWCLIQCNKSGHPDLQGDWFALEQYMQPNLEVIGHINDNPELI